MSTIPSTNPRAYENPYSSARSRAGEEEQASGSGDAETAGTGESSSASPEETQALNAYKQEILTKIKNLMKAPHLANVNLELNISDAGFRKMMQDPAYEKSLLDGLRAKTAHAYTAMDGTLSLSANGTDEPSARLDRRQTVAQSIFSGSSRSLVRSMGIDSLIAFAEESILAREEGYASRFEAAGLLGANRMRTPNSLIDAYLKNLNNAADSVDETS